MPLLERVRVEVYLPDGSSPEYENLLRSFTGEFTVAFGGCSTIRGVEGSYLSELGVVIADRVNVIYSDTPLNLSEDFELAAAYARVVKHVAMEALPEEEVLVSVAQIYHTV